jgi:hypothetical protein
LSTGTGQEPLHFKHYGICRYSGPKQYHQHSCNQEEMTLYISSSCDSPGIKSPNDQGFTDSMFPANCIVDQSNLKESQFLLGGKAEQIAADDYCDVTCTRSSTLRSKLEKLETKMMECKRKA